MLVICHLSFVICYLSFVICHLSFVICHLSFVICHLSFVLSVRVASRREVVGAASRREVFVICQCPIT
jgi:hypothetical protein